MAAAGVSARAPGGGGGGGGGAPPHPPSAVHPWRAPRAAATATSTAAVSEKKPRTLTAPRKSGADDLQQITGVGPKLEQTLNEMGFWHFDQIAKWTKPQIAWVDSRLKFKGRIARDNWVKQAAKLAKK